MENLPKLLSTLRKYGVTDFARTKDGAITVKFGSLPPEPEEKAEDKTPRPENALVLARELGLVGEAS